MSLDGTPLLITLIAITFAMPFGVPWAWPRVRGGRWIRRLQHVLLVLGTQLVTLLLAGVALNDYGQFFSSWSQAMGAVFSTAPTTAMGNAGLGNLAVFGAASPPSSPVPGATRHVTPTRQLPTGLKPTGWSSPAEYATRGAVAELRLYGPQSQLSNDAAVYLPPAYFAGDRSLPLVEFLTGYPSTVSSLTERLHVPGHLLRGIRARTVAQLVVVMIPVGVPYPLDSECTDAPGGPFAFTFFDRDVPQVVTSMLGLAPTAYAALGYSTGGYCATKLAMLDPSHFRAAASMSGYFHAEPGKYSPNLFAGSERLKQDSDLRWRLQHYRAPATSVLIMTGTEEIGADGWTNNTKFLQAVRPPMYAERYIVPVDYGHSVRTWAQEVSPALVWISRTLGVTSGHGGIGSASFSRQGLSRNRHHDRHPRQRARPTATSTPSRTATPTPSGSSAPTPRTPH